MDCVDKSFFVYSSYQVAKLPQIVQQQQTVANIQQIVSSPQQVVFFLRYPLV